MKSFSLSVCALACALLPAFATPSRQVSNNGQTVGIAQVNSSASRSRHAKSLAGKQQVKVFLVALGDNGKIGKKFGCEDSLVPVKRAIKATNSPLKTAIQHLLSIPPDYPENPQLKNFWKGRNLRLKSVSLRKGLATIHISGEVFVAGICDEPRIIEQIEATSRQFASVKRVKVLLNGQPLVEAIR